MIKNFYLKKTTKIKVKRNSKLKYIFIFIIIVFLVFLYKKIDFEFINRIFIDNQYYIENSKYFAAILIVFLRSLSIIIPVIPGTYCSVICGYIFGIKSGLPLIFFADLISCSICFSISRVLGRDFVEKLLGNNQMKKIEKFSKQYFEQNLFLLTAILMTSWFDFVCYAVGLTKLSWKKFIFPLMISIVISDLPFVAGGYALSQIKDINFSQIFNGEVSIIEGPYLAILISSVLVVFTLGILNVFTSRKIRN